ncbi:hypothetical protein E2C01_038979 [Portunus trituberculatus]|uniref:Uncharacterized protein n=1 Tax=Portunus trituberculatus TaxID=210409 RepID=A0A5B7FIE2_PORTR|nr:hypothetical protein [Portunus trituberculatus]
MKTNCVINSKAYSAVQLPPISGTGPISPPKHIFGIRQLHLHLEPGYHGDMQVTLNHSTIDEISRKHVMGFKPTHRHLPNPTLTTLFTTPLRPIS